MDTTDAAFEDFPSGSWWIRWIDHVVMESDSANPKIHLVLSRWRKGKAPKALINDTRDSCLQPIAIGLACAFAVGDIIVDGRRDQDAGGRTRSIFAEVRAFDIDLPAGFLGSFELHRKDVIVREEPKDRAEEFHNTLLQFFDYPGLANRKSRCAVFRDEHGSIALVPAAEMIRAFMAPQSDILWALTCGEWLKARAELIDVLRTSHDQDEPVEPFVIALRKKIDDRFAAYLANLMPARNPAGARAVEDIRTTMASKDGGPSKKLIKDDPLSNLPKGAMSLPACLPFDRGTLAMRLRGIVLPGGEFLGVKVIGGIWPDPRPIEILREDVVVEGELEDGDSSGGGKGQRKPEDGVIEPTATPGYGEGRATIDADAPDFAAMPECTVTRRTETRAPGPRGGGGSQESSGYGVGPPAGTGTAYEAVVEGNPLPGSLSQFDNLVAVMRELLAERAIKAFRIVPSSFLPAQRGSQDVWAFDTQRELPGKPPKRNAWTALVPRRANPRTALILEIVLSDGSIAYWFEIENRPNDRHCAILASFPGPASQARLKALMDALQDARGRVSDEAGFAKNVGAAVIRRFVHRKAGMEAKPSPFISNLRSDIVRIALASLASR